MEEMQALQIRFPARLLAARRDDRGVLYQLFYRTDNETYVIHHDDPEGPPWLEDGGASGLTPADIRLWWPELADAAALD
jgi:hypothetical protein